MHNDFEISFDESENENTHPPVSVKRGESLSVLLDVDNSPILFGCRTGICGTCLIEVLEVTAGELPCPDEIERESLELYAPGNSKARLACQISACASMRVRKVQAI